MSILGVDLASYQGAPDFDKLRGAGVEFAVTKLTQGTGYAFPGARRNRSEALRTGMVSGLYHFVDFGDPKAEADYFCNNAGALAPGEFLALDYDTNKGNPVPWALAWLSEVESHYGIKPLIYINQDTLHSHDWSAAKDYGLWLPVYDGTENMPTGLPVWGSPAIKQYSSAGQLPGINGKVDLNAFYGTQDQLRKYGGAGTPVVSPSAGWQTLPTLSRGDKGPAVASLQRFLNAYNWQPPLPLLPVTGNYLDQTTSVLRAAQRQMGVRNADGTQADGTRIGDMTKPALWARGWRG